MKNLLICRRFLITLIDFHLFNPNNRMLDPPGEVKITIK